MPTADQLKQQLLELSILTLITIIIWIGYEVYSALVHPSEAIVSSEELREVPTVLDTQQFDKLKGRLTITDEMLNQVVVLGGGIAAKEASPTSELNTATNPELMIPETTSAGALSF